MTNRLFLSWQNVHSRRWFPIGQLTQQNGTFRFVYVRGVEEAKAEGFTQVPEFPDWEAIYESDRLFPTFANRVMPVSRPDFSQYIDWLRLEGQEKDPLAFLARTEGKRQTDSLEVFPAAEPLEGGGWRVQFFVHGLRHMSPEAEKRVLDLEPGEQLRLLWDMQNPVHPEALMLRTHGKPSGDTTNIGYCPRYLVREVLTALKSDPLSAAIYVVNIAPVLVPIQYRILAELRLTTNGVVPFSSKEFLPIVGE